MLGANTPRGRDRGSKLPSCQNFDRQVVTGCHRAEAGRPLLDVINLLRLKFGCEWCRHYSGDWRVVESKHGGGGRMAFRFLFSFSSSTVAFPPKCPSVPAPLLESQMRCGAVCVTRILWMMWGENLSNHVMRTRRPSYTEQGKKETTAMSAESCP